ncbi:GlxA family transcriptional regulator [Cobetia sp. QF-1]|uniref:GlxA family transcriptional regulator n=1 Tax=Cobetia sp. QF-1 TaxID=1969833 RepID=UPI000B53E303|nr:GlxA family transcriptional regulator [Cobetia sp. QF-1]
MTDSRRRDFTPSMKLRNQRLLQDVDCPRAGPLNVAFILLEHFSMPAFTTALDALVTANLLREMPFYRMQTYGVTGGSVRSDLGIDIMVGGELAELLHAQVDLVVVCGGYRVRLETLPTLNEALRRAAQHDCRLGSLWNGSYFLAEAGVMEGHTCTIHPENVALFNETFPQLELSCAPLVVEGARFTSASAGSALDMMLEAMRQRLGDDLARSVEEILACDRPAQPCAWHVEQQLPVPDSHLPEALRTILTLMSSNLEEPLSMSEMSRYVTLSRRQIERLFTRHLDTTPSRHYLELRLTRARQLLTQGNASITEVTLACGFVSTTHFSHCFRDYFGMSPSRARQRS